MDGLPALRREPRALRLRPVRGGRRRDRAHPPAAGGFFGGRDPSRLVFSHNSTDALNLAIFGLLGPATTRSPPTSSTTRCCDRSTTSRRTRGWPSTRSLRRKGFVDPDDIERRFRRNTRLVVVNHARTSSDGAAGRRDRPALSRARVTLLVDASRPPARSDRRGGAADRRAGVHRAQVADGPTGSAGCTCGREPRSGRPGREGPVCARRSAATCRSIPTGSSTARSTRSAWRVWRWRRLARGAGLAEIERHEVRLLSRLRDGSATFRVTTYCQDDLAGHIAVFLSTWRASSLEHRHADRRGPQHRLPDRLHCAPLVHESLGRVDQGAVRFGSDRSTPTPTSTGRRCGERDRGRPALSRRWAAARVSSRGCSWRRAVPAASRSAALSARGRVLGSSGEGRWRGSPTTTSRLHARDDDALPGRDAAAAAELRSGDVITPCWP